MVSFIVDRDGIESWVKKKYKVNLLEQKCSLCKSQMRRDNLDRVFSQDGKIYFVCNDRNCRVYGNQTIVVKSDKKVKGGEKK